MQLDLNQPFTKNDVAELLRSQDDSRSRQLRVTDKDIAFLSDEIGNRNIENLSFRLYTWMPGNDYTGEKAENDEKFVSRIEKVLRDNWPNPCSTLIERFLIKNPNKYRNHYRFQRHSSHF